MSWSRRRLLAAAALLPLGGGLGGALSGCVVRPLYGTAATSGEGRGADDLAATAIRPIANRSGQQLHNALRDMLNPRGQPTSARYDLAIGLEENLRESGLRRTETSTRGTLTLRTDYRLTDREDGRLLTSGRAQSIVGYNLVDSGYANHVSASDARERGLRELAQEIRRRLALHFAEAAG